TPFGGPRLLRGVINSHFKLFCLQRKQKGGPLHFDRLLRQQLQAI
ncbi:20590_t:CDS:1, partial [Dentiscutata erythropus]